MIIELKVSYSEEIEWLYKKLWYIELFFKWIKQNLINWYVKYNLCRIHIFLHYFQRGGVMEKVKKVINVLDIKVGMIPLDDVKDDGIVLIAKGVPITETIIYRLRGRHSLGKIEVYYEYENIKDLSKTKKQKTVKEVEESFQELSFDVESIFKNMNHLEKSGIDEVRKFARKIENELESTSAIIKNIVLYGSGQDTIYRHGVNVAALSFVIGKWVGFNKVDINLLTYSAVLHDFGKVKIEKDILEKAGPLTKKEYEIIKKHPLVAYNHIKEIPFLDKRVSYGILMHHEKLNGSGYPLGLKNEEITPFAKIIAIADVFDAINSDRVYKKSKGPFEALEIVQKESLQTLDYEYCKVFLDHVVNFYFGESVLLNNGQVGKIIHIDSSNIGRPMLLCDNEFIDLKVNKNLNVEKLILQ